MPNGDDIAAGLAVRPGTPLLNGVDQRRSGRLSLRYWAVVGGLLTAFLVIGGAVEIFSAFRENVARLATVQRALAHLVGGQVDFVLATIERSLTDTASLPWREGLLGVEDARQEFHRLLKIAPAIHAVRGVGFRGEPILQVSRFEPDEVANTAPLDKPNTQPPPARGFSAVAYRNDSEPFVTLRVVPSGNGGLFGYIEADLSLRFVSEVMVNAIPASNAQAYVIDGIGNLIAHSDRSLPLQRLNLRALEHVAALNAGNETLDGLSGLRSRNLSGADIVVSGVRIKSANWTAFIEEPLQNATKDAWATARRTIFLILAGLLAAVLVSFLLARRLSRPIVEVRAGAQRIAQGDLAARIHVDTGDEIEALADDFNRMAQKLEEYTSGLEHKVNEKTAELQQALQVARDAMRARSLFLAAASHDLRQPLYAISILADALVPEIPGAARETLDKQREAIAILRRLFDNLLDLSRFESGHVQAHPRAVSLRQVLASVAMEHEVVARARGLAWHCETGDVTVFTDPELLRRLLGNLLSNAVRYTPRGSVSMIASNEGGFARVEISDTGVGIPVEQQQRVFEEFVQLDNPGRERDRGVGLGLSIVRKINDLLGSNLQLSSLPGQGTRVTLQLPLAAEAALTPEDAWGAGSAEAQLIGLRVWVLEDDPLVRDALAIQFAAWGVEHTFALSRAQVEALRESQGEWPQAIILDDMLGHGESGLELARWLEEHLSRSRILMVTGNVEGSAVEALMSSGFEVMRKPVAAEVLARWLEGTQPASP